ncbi:hypothetical protein ACFQI3_10045 [Hansschlegelia quercus]|uniref:Uncharacterized protein n=1 Tax=Hansschlegelia quercus TaxID=2528245 RepID=A0A4Q9GJU7_9HYPH|nr:hypothetical protein [Hansschlegelia quercus]TBN54408.1 hypothetical protein EYR15_06125 [Hansschlegelia quercus]
MAARWPLIGVLAAALLASGAPASAAPGDSQFVGLERHDPSALLKAVRAGSDFVKGGRGRQFRVILANAGVISVIPGVALVQRDLPPLLRGAGGLKIIACKETLDALARANRRRVPVISGVTVMSCRGLRNKMTVTGWQPAIGFE